MTEVWEELVRRFGGEGWRWIFPCHVIDVTDGDTVKLEVDLGFRVMTQVAVRLEGVNAPEIYTSNDYEKARGIKARAIVEHWLYEPRASYTFYLATNKDKRTFNRYVGDIFDDGGNSLVEFLLRHESGLFTRGES